jgi:hypothetical protein
MYARNIYLILPRSQVTEDNIADTSNKNQLCKELAGLEFHGLQVQSFGTFYSILLSPIQNIMWGLTQQTPKLDFDFWFLLYCNGCSNKILTTTKCFQMLTQ